MEDKSMKIYVITKGEYSDYRIVAVAIDPEKADQLAEFFSDRYDTAEVEEYDTEDVPDLTKGMKVFCIRFNKCGEVVYIHERPDCWDCSIALCADCSVLMYIQANNEEEAIKIGAEKRAKYLAERMGL
jgi:hypothetical protein